MLLDTIVRYCQVLSRKGRAEADAAIAGEDPAIREQIRANFNDAGKLIKADGSRVTIPDLMKLGIMPI